VIFCSLATSRWRLSAVVYLFTLRRDGRRRLRVLPARIKDKTTMITNGQTDHAGLGGRTVFLFAAAVAVA